MNRDQSVWSNRDGSEWSPPAVDLGGSDVAANQAMQLAYETHAKTLLRVAFVLTGSKVAAEDVVQDVFVQSANRLADVREAGPYLRTAVVNRCRSLYRRTKAAPPLPRGYDTDLDVGLIELRDSLAALSPKQRSAIVLRYLCDLSDADIAETLGVRQPTVRSLIFRGLRELRKSITSFEPSQPSDPQPSDPQPSKPQTSNNQQDA